MDTAGAPFLSALIVLVLILSIVVVKPLIDLAKKELNWKPHIQLQEGLKRTIEYFSKVV